MKLEQYFAGFRLVSCIDLSGLRYYPVANASAIRRGYMVGFSAGYGAEITTIQNVGIAGIAAEANTAAEASSSGAVNVGVIPLLPQHRFAVPIEQDSVIDQADVGSIFDLQSANTLDISDAITLGFGFRIDDFDASTEAVAENTYGYAIGHFEYIAAS